MTIPSDFIAALKHGFLSIFNNNATAHYVDAQSPLRAELFSAEQMAQHGKTLATAHILAARNVPDQLLARLADNEATLVNVSQLLTSAIASKRRITPAGIWLLDNFYLIEEQIRTAKRHLPKSYSRELPQLATHAGLSQGHLRVYDLALEIISHGDGRLDSDSLSRFIAAYQTIAPLKLGELWAIPIMLRLAVIENLRRVAVRIATGLAERTLADRWADEMRNAAKTDPKSLILVISDMARSDPPMVSAFVAELVRRLQGRGPALTLPLTWIEQRLAELGLTIQQLVQTENQQQAADQVSISNSIGSLRVLMAMDWRDFVESLSLVEQTLREDPAGIYTEMDFATRDNYRHVIEATAKKSHLDEAAVARQAIELAAKAMALTADDANIDSSKVARTAHVGFYLIDNGLPILEHHAAMRLSGSKIIKRKTSAFSLPLYLGIITAITLSASAGLWYVASRNPLTTAALTAIAILLLIATSQLAIALVNWLITILIAPKTLPRMDFSKGVPAQLRTLVVVPSMLSTIADNEALLETLEVHFLANRDAALHFALLTDFADSAAEFTSDDEELLQHISAGIAQLNASYATQTKTEPADIFFLLHRPRRWNPQEQLWMGYERKRGKLAELNALLRDTDNSATREKFSFIVGDCSILSSIRYVITLDTDTQLPRDTARQFVAAMAHPLNHPYVDPVQRRVTKGYGILQPRIGISLPATNRSRYAQLYGDEPGIDPYTRAVSDVYQDLFDEGSFIGKGIYDVDAFEKVLCGRFPENCILSHDLLEGCYARAGLLSDVQLYEDYPAHYCADMRRRHRWIRGDWQLAAWLMRRVLWENTEQTDNSEKTNDNKQKQNSAHKKPQRERHLLSALSQWKLLDNLRRSLVPIALTLLLLVGWTLLTKATLADLGLWTAAVIGILLIPSLCSSLIELLRKPDEVRWQQHLAMIGRTLLKQLAQTFFDVACLPYEAYISLDAILRTLWRLLISRKKLLEWHTSSDVNRRTTSDLATSFRAMWIAPAIALATLVYLALVTPAVLLIAAPILLLWFVAPLCAWWISHPVVERKPQLDSTQTLFLRKLARRTWAFFDTFVCADDNWLPPDNCQDYRVAAVAHRTSPTNIGMALLANLSAYDFGYLLAGQLLERTANTLRTMGKLERYRGHFYNWYDTKTLQVMAPRYISTVDSGNLAGHLLTLRGGLITLANEAIFLPRIFDGLGDTLAILLDSDTGDKDPLALFSEALGATHLFPATTLAAVHFSLRRLSQYADGQLAAYAADAGQLHVQQLQQQQPPQQQQTNAVTKPTGDNEKLYWLTALAQQCRAAVDELEFLAPWLLLPAPPAGISAIIDLANLYTIPSLRQLAAADSELCPVVARCLDEKTLSAEQSSWLENLHAALIDGSARARERWLLAEDLAQQVSEFATMDYEFLFDKTRHLLTIGYNVGEFRADASYYDLLASEARLCSFVAIAQGQLPQASWFSLGRLLTSAGGEPVLLSWSGSMFEYLMPLLVMPTYDNTLLDQTCKAAVMRQIDYGNQRGVPWGMSESCYNTVDAQLNYQYRAFGVPGLGLKLGLAEDLVIAPYASVMALMVAPEAACSNLQRMAADGYIGKYGFFEAIDFTPARQRRGQASAIVRAFMAHHQGMSLLALAYLLLDKPMQRRFEADRLFQAVMLLLQERIPRATTLFAHTAELSNALSALAPEESPVRVFNNPDTAVPEVQLLSNGRYHVMVTSAGGGYSRWNNLAVTRWREDSTRDHWGTFCYIRDITHGVHEKNHFWSTAYQPTLNRPEHYEAIFFEGRAEFRRRDAISASENDSGILNNSEYFETHTDIVVSPEDDIELRRTRITNRSQQTRRIDVTSYADVVMAPAAADAMHPAFSNLFVQTEILRDQRAIICTRRPRSQHEHAPWMLHLMTVHGAEISGVSYETDRAKFIGRGKTTAAPQALTATDLLSNTEGSVLDPVIAIRYSIILEAEQSVTIDIVTGMTDSRDAAIGLVDKYHDRYLSDRVFDLVSTHSQVVLRQLNASEADAQLYARLASSIIYANASLRADASVLINNRRGQSNLWGYSISGDLPIVLLQIADAANIDLVRQLVQAHAYWRMKGLAVDLVIWNEGHTSYRQPLQEQILGLIASGVEVSVIDQPGGIFVRPAEQISTEDRILLQSVARIVISDSRGNLLEQLDHRILSETRVPRFMPTRQIEHFAEAPVDNLAREDLLLDNGLGGFSADGREYIINLSTENITPAPWINVLANRHFGTIVSENGVAYTWNENAHAFRLTPWHNDPVSDSGGEALYIRDEETGQFWSPSVLPVGNNRSRVRHGFGYSVFETDCNGIHSELWIYVAIDAAIKFSVLKLRNTSGRSRKLSVTGYVEWVLGDLRATSAMHVNTEIDAQNGAVYARNSYNTEFAERVAFFDVDEPVRSISGDRREFIGRNGTLKNPAALQRARLSGNVGTGLDPCAAIQLQLELAAGQRRDVIFRLGVGQNIADAGALIRRFRGTQAAGEALDAVKNYWQHSLSAVQVETPDTALNVLANGWLVYQTLACRLWARSGYYQSGGAFGFRDQLQDVMALIHAEPQLVRNHLVLCAGHQFVEGDVQHWWHPPSNRGVRTHCSDDYLWLPLAVCRYIESSGDSSVLDECVHFLEGRPVNPDEDSYYDLPLQSPINASLYEHCLRAIRHGLRVGEHGLPLIGSGDWNDGMNLVGIQGRGESIWLGFFLCEVLRHFIPLARTRNDHDFAAECEKKSAQLRKNLEQYGWDGNWYRRAYFDDGTPLGSTSNVECRIDSISQSWSVISGAADPQRSRMAMNAVYEKLVRRDDKLIQLLDPPFSNSALDPGYIRGYVPGVRENGGQYTHGAVWAAMAFAALGDSERAWELLTLLNPVNHALDATAVAIYKVEPYVVTADVYGVAPHTGRGGWSWYTGSAGWTYRLIIESILGLKRIGATLHITPCIPAAWPEFTLHYRYCETLHHIHVMQKIVAEILVGKNIATITVDGITQVDSIIPLSDDQREHQIDVIVLRAAATPIQPLRIDNMH